MAPCLPSCAFVATLHEKLLTLELLAMPLPPAFCPAFCRVASGPAANRHAKGEPKLKSFVGTAYATAPEVFKESYGECCDLWAIGVVTYAMLCGRRPFIGREIPNVVGSKYRSMVADIVMGNFVWPRGSKGLSACCKNFVESLLIIGEK